METAILALRETQLGPARIALQVPASATTVYRTLVRYGRNQLRVPAPRVVRRFEKTRRANWSTWT